MWMRIFPLIGIVSALNQETYRKISRFVLRRGGVAIEGLPLWVSPRAFLDVSFRNSIRIGDRTVVSHYVKILTHDFSLDRAAERLETSKPPEFEYYKQSAVIVGDQVFLGLGCTIMPGVSIGDGAIVATNAVVTRDVAPDTVVAGVPARFVSTTRDYLDKRREEFGLRRRRR